MSTERDVAVDVVIPLPQHLRERADVLEGSVSRTGHYVLYWLQHAMRCDENPALDAAAWLAQEWQLPLLVFQELSYDQPYASDRTFGFALEGVRDLQQQMSRLGYMYAFHLCRSPQDRSLLEELADEAAVVVTEQMPLKDSRDRRQRLVQATRRWLLAIDTACVVPMRLVPQAFDRAFAFRQATRSLYAARLERIWPTMSQVPHPAPFPTSLDESLQHLSADIAPWLAQCEIDHQLPPVFDTRGGTMAGYARWSHFRDRRMKYYARDRNDPLRPGTSRLSAYLHWGMVSPLRVAREAAMLTRASETREGAEKYLDELTIWREMAYAFCYHRPEVDSLAALPDWAVETLRQHATDPRPAILDWEKLMRAQSGHPLWDASQMSLLRQGELHNNLRMTWGKALLAWTTGPEEALRWLIDLNHRLALDGHDPASYGGLLWCLGQFDRPFSPERPMIGKVRPRPLDEHAGRMQIATYQQHVTRRPAGKLPRVAVIGAGMSGLVCARTLIDQGWEVTVFEKSRGAGGRMATRRVPGVTQFDHGAQYFTARDPRFQRWVAAWEQQGIVEAWRGRIVSLEHGRVEETRSPTLRYVGRPGMSALGRHLAADVRLITETRLVGLGRQHGLWNLTLDGQAAGVDPLAFDVLVLAIPAPQAVELLPGDCRWKHQLGQLYMLPCWATMFSLPNSLDVPWEGAFVHGSPISWVACNSRKPGRESKTEDWVLHANPNWSRMHLETPAEEVMAQMLQAFWRITGSSVQQPVFAAAHRWRWALPEDALSERCLFDAELNLGLCGDWCGGPRVEGAFLSGAALAGRIMSCPTVRSQSCR